MNSTQIVFCGTNNAFNANSDTQQQAEDLYKKLGLDSDAKRQAFVDMSKLSNPFAKKTTKLSYSSDLKNVTTAYLEG